MYFSNKVIQVTLCYIVIVLLASCSSVTPVPNFETSQITITKLDVKSELQKLAKIYEGDNYRNCIATPFDVPGQGLRAMGSGLRAMGSVGGLFINEPSVSVQNYHPQRVSRYMQGFSGFDSDENVAIIVLDQFSSENESGTRSYAYRVGSGVYGLVDAAREGEDRLERKFANLRAQGQISHGALVFEHTQEVLNGLPNVNASRYNKYSRVQKTYYYNGQRFVIRAVDVADLDTDNIADALESTISSLRRQGINKFSVNMSFSVVPCALSELAEDFDSIEAYFDAIEAGDSDDQFDADEFMNLMSWLTARSNDPLLGRIATNYGQGIWARDDIALISSAGNFSGRYPLLPALSRDVISVSSFDFPRFDISEFSNNGEVSAPGWLFKLDNSKEGRAISYAGTSFSSPAVAVYAALDLSQSSPKCFSERQASDLLSYGSYGNSSLRDAVNTCR